jgi:hypothetical protein
MSAVGSPELQNKAGEISVLQSDQLAGRIAYRPFYGKLGVDGELKLSDEMFNEKFYDFFKNITLNPLSQFKTMPPFPTPTCWPNLPPKHTETTINERLTLNMRHGWL